METSRGHLQSTTTDETSCLSPFPGHPLLLLPEPWLAFQMASLGEDAPVHPVCVAAQPLFYASWDLATGPLALETKEYPDKGTGSCFQGCLSAIPPIFLKARSRTLAMVVAQVDISPVPSTWSLSTEINKLALREEWDGMLHRCVEAAQPQPCLCATSWVTLLETVVEDHIQQSPFFFNTNPACHR